ncbi:tRNA (adenine(22)-N(1))-methyltransferase [Paenibacillus contaminans]|uniref:tRNA (Adenine-N(1))-methyltransferase n=1 Tax=Paenibacillus contaminans TaxID=450362 RepID=A0A329MPR6_9BACL|nr:tRNA (adenine(22)-N(1))-methyltransferase TrmK [Paenibacillus contaminans]RAV21744.1 tRNA (adenine-N(1))-methyltransferase [Paenibacillus contaminans]
MVTLSNRLALIARLVPEGGKLADIGSDHALLPVFLCQQGIAVSAIAGELNPGPFAAAQKQVREAGLEKRIEVRRGDGLAVIEPGEADVVTIAGMGGSLIASILSAGEDKLKETERLILQPNVGEEQVRRWLVEHGWALVDEHILEEDGKIYEVLVAVREGAASVNDRLYGGADSETAFRMGPYLLNKPSPVFVSKWQSELVKLNRIVHQLGESELEAAADKKAAFEKEIADIERVLAGSGRN